MSMFLSRLIFMSWVLLQSKNAYKCSEVPEMKFALYDGLREPTSFLYENGFIEASCKAPSITPNAEIMLRATPKNAKSIVVEQGNGSLSFNVSLREFDYEKLFCYSNPEHSPNLILTDRLCDPMLLIPPTTMCGDKEVCMKTAKSSSRCENIDKLKCDMDAYKLFERNLMAEKYICIPNVALDKLPMKGFCEAKKANIKHISGIASHKEECASYTDLKIDGEIAEQESTWFKSIRNKILICEFTAISKRFDEAVCQMTTSNKDKIGIVTGFPMNTTSTNKERVLDLSFNSEAIALPLGLPTKIKLTCTVSDRDRQLTKSTSVYLILFDEKKFFPAIKTTLIDANTGLYSLNCEAKMVDGILFSVSWDREPNTYFAKTSDDIIIVNKFDDSAQKHTCYVAAFAYYYPYKGKLLKLDLPSGSVNNSVEIEKGGAPGKCLYDTEHKTPGFCDGNAGSGTVKLDKDMMHHAAGKSAKETSVDLSHNSHFQKWEQV